MAIAPIELDDDFYPWEKLPNESSMWYRRFCRYRNQIGARSLLACVRQEWAERQESTVEKGKKKCPQRVPNSWIQASARFSWEKRAEFYDLFVQNQDDALWQERIKKIREQSWTAYDKLMEKAWMLLQPNYQGELSKNYLVVLKIMEVANSLGQYAIGDINRAFTILKNAGFDISHPEFNSTLIDFDSQIQNKNPDPPQS